MIVSANHLLQCVSEHEQEEHVSEEMGRAGVKEESSEQGPDSASQQVVPAEHEIRVDEVRVLLPSPEAEAYASQYEQIVYSQPGPRLNRWGSRRPISEVPNHSRRASRHFSHFVRAVCAKPFYKPTSPNHAFPLGV